MAGDDDPAYWKRVNAEDAADEVLKTKAKTWFWGFVCGLIAAWLLSRLASFWR